MVPGDKGMEFIHGLCLPGFIFFQAAWVKPNIISNFLQFTVAVLAADQAVRMMVRYQKFHRYPANEWLGEAWYRSKQDMGRVIDTLGQLVTGGLSAKELGGPVMIFQATTTQARMGYYWLLEITAFISINLAIFKVGKE